MTSHTSMSNASQMIWNSFTRAIFTPRNMFSKSFCISAVRMLETGTRVLVMLL